ncbi:MAG TPA: hypothetical protein QF409_06320 [Acidimicrobiales bacterium]|nr:hypothetical protein [Acidimicrobiales bacterium]
MSADGGDLIRVGKPPVKMTHCNFQASVAPWRQALSTRVSSTADVDSVAQTEGIVRTGHRDIYWQYYSAAGRLFDLLGDELYGS